jgi:hypothetical protein
MKIIPLLAISALCVSLSAQTPDPKPEKPAEPQKSTPSDAKKADKDKVDFKAMVLPILEKNCFECHRTAHVTADGKVRRPKGSVVLDAKDSILKSRKGKFLVAGKPDQSEMIHAISLPADDEDRMPPQKKGDPLPKEQIELLKKWVAQGADFGDWKSNPLPQGSKPATGKDGQGDRGKKGGDDKDGDGKKGEDGKKGGD